MQVYHCLRYTSLCVSEERKHVKPQRSRLTTHLLQRVSAPGREGTTYSANTGSKQGRQPPASSSFALAGQPAGSLGKQPPGALRCGSHGLLTLLQWPKARMGWSPAETGDHPPTAYVCGYYSAQCSRGMTIPSLIALMKPCSGFLDCRPSGAAE